MSKKNSFFSKNSKALTENLIELYKDHLPQLMNFTLNIRKEYIEVLTEEGSNIAVLTAYHNIDDVMQQAYANDSRTISCNNCTAAYCCHLSVEICEAEAALIGQYCKENKIKISRKHLQKQLMHRRENIGKADCSTCVFLKDNRCGIYPVRPAGCRIHHTITPIEYCDTKNDLHEDDIGMLTSNYAQIIKAVLFDQGGKMDRMPRLLMKYSQ